MLTGSQIGRFVVIGLLAALLAGPAHAAPTEPALKSCASQSSIIQVAVACSGQDGPEEPAKLTPEQARALADRRAAAAAERRRQASVCLSRMFSNGGEITTECVPYLTTPEGQAPALSREDVRSIAETTIVQIALPLPQVMIGPDPSVNEWKMAVVGFPLWLWTPAQAPISSTNTAGGFPLAISARQASTTFTMGDGGTVTCVTGTPYPGSITPGTPSPDCGYRY